MLEAIFKVNTVIPFTLKGNTGKTLKASGDTVHH